MKVSKVTLIVLFTFLINLALINPSIAQDVVFDSTTGFFGLDADQGPGFYQLNLELEKRGYSVTDIVELKRNSLVIEKRVLNGADIFVIINPIREYSFEEKDILTDYVSDGGNVLLVCDNPRYMENANSIASVFGGEFIGYYLGDKVRISDHNAFLYSPMAVEVEDSNYSINVYAEAIEWIDTFELSKEKTGKYSVLSMQHFGNGSVVLLGDKDFLKNSRIGEDNNSLFAGFIFNIMDEGVKVAEEKYKKPEINYRSNLDTELSNRKSAVVSLLLNNSGGNQSIKVKVPDYLQGIITPFSDEFDLSTGQTKIIRFRINWTDEYYSVNDFITVKRVRLATNETFRDYIPIMVVWNEKAD